MLVALDGPDPLLELLVEGRLEAVDVRLAHGVAVARQVAHVHLLLVAQADRAGLHDQLALDGVAELDVDVDLVVNQDARGRPGHQDERVPEVVEAVGGGARGVHAHGDDLLAQQEPADVDLVDGGVVDHVARRVALRNRGVAVTAVDERGVAVVAGVEDRLHLVVGGVEAAHEADGDQLLAGLLLGLHDLDAVLGGGGQGLLAQHVLARLDDPDDVGGVDLAEGRDDDGVDVGVVDELLGGVVGPGPVGLGAGDGGVMVDVGDGDDPAARQVVGDAGEVGAAHAAGADESNANGHVCISLP